MRNNKYSDYKIFGFKEKLDSFLSNDVTAPVYVRIKPTNRCNHDCYWCVYAKSFRKKNKDDELGLGHLDSEMHSDMVESDIIPLDKLIETLDIFKDIGVKAVTYSGGGEPLFYKHIVEVMKRTVDNNIDLSIITNGELLNNDRADILNQAKWVRLSLDYSNSEQMRLFRRVQDSSYKRVLSNIESFSKTKSASCDLGLNYIIHKDNYSNLFEFSRMMKDLGVENIRFSPVWLQDFKDYHSKIYSAVLKELEKIESLIDNKFTVNTTYSISDQSHLSVRPYKKCFINQIVPVIGADMNVYTCHNKAYDKDGIVGNIREKRFDELWFSNETKHFFDKFDAQKSCNHQCSADKKNMIINDYLDSSFDNFI